MRCDHDGHADLMEGDEDVQDARRRLGVQISGGLVGNEEPRTIDDGARDGDALLLAAGELNGLARSRASSPTCRGPRARRAASFAGCAEKESGSITLS